MGHKIYVATSWRNQYQPGLVERLRSWGHDVYDFRNPKPGKTGFEWAEIDPDWREWSTYQYRDALRHPIAQDGYDLDFAALDRCDVVVLLLPSGASAHTEAAWHRGRGGTVIVYSPEPCQPELMYKLFNTIAADESELRFFLLDPLPVLKHLSLARRNDA
jgi:hypothetical protein